MAINKEDQSRIDDLAVRVQTWRTMQNYFAKLEREKKFSEADQVLEDIKEYIEPEIMWSEVNWFWKNVRTEKGREVSQQELLALLYAHRPEKSSLGVIPVAIAAILIGGAALVLIASPPLIIYALKSGDAMKYLAGKYPWVFAASKAAGAVTIVIYGLIGYGIYKAVTGRKKKATA